MSSTFYQENIMQETIYERMSKLLIDNGTPAGKVKAEMAKVCGKNRQTVYKWENGQDPDTVSISYIAEHYGADQGYLIHGDKIHKIRSKIAVFKQKTPPPAEEPEEEEEVLSDEEQEKKDGEQRSASIAAFREAVELGNVRSAY